MSNFFRPSCETFRAQSVEARYSGELLLFPGKSRMRSDNFNTNPTPFSRRARVESDSRVHEYELQPRGMVTTMVGSDGKTRDVVGPTFNYERRPSGISSTSEEVLQQIEKRTNRSRSGTPARSFHSMYIPRSTSSHAVLTSSPSPMPLSCPPSPTFSARANKIRQRRSPPRLPTYTPSATIKR